MGSSVGMTIRKLWGCLRGGEPGPPGLLRRAHTQLLLVADQRHPEEQGLQSELLEPAVLREQRRLETELREALRLPVDQGRHAELLREAPQLAATATRPCGDRATSSFVRRSGAGGTSVQGWSSLGRTAGRS